MAAEPQQVCLSLEQIIHNINTRQDPTHDTPSFVNIADWDPKEFSEENFNRIVEALEKGKHFYKVSIFVNDKITPTHVRKILEVIKKKKCVIEVEIVGFKAWEKGDMEYLATLEKLTLQCCSLTEEHLAVLATSRCLRTLCLPDNDITDKGAEILSKTPLLLNLQVPENNIKISGAIALLRNKRLQVLNIEKNPITIDDLSDFLSAAEGNFSIQKLFMNILTEKTEYEKNLSPEEVKEIGDAFFADLKEICERNGRNFLKLPPNKLVELARINTPEGQPIIDLSFSYFLSQMVYSFLEKYNGNSLHRAFEAIGFDPAIAFFQFYSAMSSPLLNNLIANEVHDVALKLLDVYGQRVNPNLRDYQGKTALIIAAKVYTGDKVVLKLLEMFKGKLELNAQDENGWTALHYASAYGKLDLVKALLAAGADPDIRDKKERTPLEVTTISNEELCGILESIHINYRRDCRAHRNGTRLPFRYIQNSRESFEEFEQYLATDAAKVEFKDEYEEIVTTFKDVTAAIKPLFMGVSVIAKCMVDRVLTQHWLSKLGSEKETKGNVQEKALTQVATLGIVQEKAQTQVAPLTFQFGQQVKGQVGNNSLLDSDNFLSQFFGLGEEMMTNTFVTTSHNASLSRNWNSSNNQDLDDGSQDKFTDKKDDIKKDDNKNKA